MKSIIMKSDLAQLTHLGYKTNTRRPVTPQPPIEWNHAYPISSENVPKLSFRFCKSEDHDFGGYKSPKYIVGDILYVKETFAYVWPGETRVPKEKCRIEYKAETGNRYPGEWPEDEAKGNPDAPKWCPSIHMPEWASRTHIIIQNVRAERVQSISAQDCLAEGLNERGIKRWIEWGWHPNDSHGHEFSLLWNGIYGKTEFGWAKNPWVWVYEFEKKEPDVL